MIDLKYKCWKDITIEVYEKINAIELKEEMNDEDALTANVQLLSILCDVSEEEIINLPLTQFTILIGKCEFLKDMPKYELNEYYEINGNVYQVQMNLREMTAGQYIDFQTLYKQKEKNLKNLLACVLIPKGRKYGEKYDVINVADEIYKYMNICDANSVMFFFILQYQALTRVILTSSIRTLKKEMKKEKNLMKKQMYHQAIQQAIQAKYLITNGVGIS